MIEITQSDFSIDEVVRSLQKNGVGAVVTFVGVVRDESEGRAVERVEIQVYREMAQRQLEAIREEALDKFGAKDIAIIHRFGVMDASEKIMMIAVSSAHRAEAFEACRYVIENIKRRVPIWKKEMTPEGEFWVEGEMQ